jgi:hypothetical protein
MRWLVEVTSLGRTEKDSLYVDADSWQKALTVARTLRGETDPMTGFSIELLEEGCRAVDPATRMSYEVHRAPDDGRPATLRPAAPPKVTAAPPSEVQPLPPVTSVPAAVAAPAPAAAAPAEPIARRSQFPPRPQISATATMMIGSPGPPAVAPATVVAPVAAAAPAYLPPASSSLPSQIVFKREQDATEALPLTYREYVFVVPPGSSEMAAATLVQSQLELVRASIERLSPGKLVNLAVFDVTFQGRPPVPPLATLAWKDWRGVALVSFPRQPGRAPLTIPIASPPPPPAPAPAPVAAAPAVVLAPLVNTQPPPPLAGPAFPSTSAPAPAMPSTAPANPFAPAPGNPFLPASASAPAPAPPFASAPAPAPANPFLPSSASAPAPAPAPAHPFASAPAPAPAPANPFLPAAASAPAPAPLLHPFASAPAPAIFSASNPIFAPPQQTFSPPPVFTPAPQTAPPAPTFSSNPVPTFTESQAPSFARPVASQPVPSAPLTSGSPSSRIYGEDLIADLFESMHDLHFSRDAVEGGDFCLQLAMAKLPSLAGIVQLYDINHREFLVTNTRGEGTDTLLLRRFPETDSLLAAAMRKRRAVVIGNAVDSEAATNERYVAIGGARSLIIAPVMQAGRFLGAIELVNPIDGEPFSESDGNAVSYIAEQLAEFVAARGVVTDPERISLRPQR